MSKRIAVNLLQSILPMNYTSVQQLAVIAIGNKLGLSIKIITLILLFL